MSTYQELKKANPTFPILVREAESVKAKLIARFGAVAAGSAPAQHLLQRIFQCKNLIVMILHPYALDFEIVMQSLMSGVRCADFGVEKSVAVEGMDAAGVSKQLEQLVASKPQ